MKSSTKDRTEDEDGHAGEDDRPDTQPSSDFDMTRRCTSLVPS